MAAPRTTFTKDVTKDTSKGRAKAEGPTADKRNDGVLDITTTSLTASTYSNYEGKIRLFVEFCIDKEDIPPLDYTAEPTCARYLTWIAERGTIGAGFLQPCVSAINTGREDAPATGRAFIDMKRALQIRQLKTIEELQQRINAMLAGPVAVLANARRNP
eukprot:jgi/Tetstr1/420987/TSEL_012047.t1